MANTVLGAGLLAVPRCISFAGIVPGVLLVVFSAACAIITNVFISDAAEAVGGSASFRRLSDAALPRLSLAVDGAVVVAAMGVGVTYFIIASDGFVDAIAALFSCDPPARWACILAVAAVATPLSLLRSLDSLRATSLFAVLILFFITGLVIAYALPAAEAGPLVTCPADGTASPLSCPPGPVRLFTNLEGAMSAMPTLAMAYT